MKQAIAFMALIALVRCGVASELKFGKEVTLPDGTCIISKVVRIDDSTSVARYVGDLRKHYKNAFSGKEPGLVPPKIPTALSEVVVLQRTDGADVKLWSYMLPALSEEALHSPMLPTPRAIFLIPSTGRLILIWQGIRRKLDARELEKNVVYEKQPYGAEDFYHMRSFDSVQSIDTLTENAAGELEVRITVDGKPITLKRSGSVWRVVE